MSKLPVQGTFRVTATYGQSGKYWANGHKGIDFVADNKTIYSPCDGVVRVVAFDTGGWGQYVSIGDESQRRHILCHMVRGSILVAKGQTVSKGTPIGTMGSTGNSTGVHLHYELHDSAGRVIDVTDYLGIPNKTGSYNSETLNLPKEKTKPVAQPMIYNSVEQVPTYAKQTIQKLVDQKFLQGDEKGDLKLSEDMIRILVILDRAGVFNN